ncbi:alginate lyase family protein [Litorimonas sp.]|uniref:alginate lyase family protein n=1 Tax=Litorimonas sp. TaxID=1892381 RepID=UPI003A899960
MARSRHFFSVPAFILISALSACEDVEGTDAVNQSQEVARVMSETSPEALSECGAATITSDDRARVLQKAKAYLEAQPETVTANRAERSTGGPNDFYSEGDYWWPVPGQPDAPYEQRDGQTNPDNFVAHRLSMIRLSDILGSLASAYKLTGEQKYADAAAEHLRAWFVTPETRMNPNLLYAQAIKGRHTGRSIGIIDTLHLIETARSAKVLGEAGALPEDDYAAVIDWFDAYSNWMNTHPHGIEEREWPNNHSIAWSLQIAAFSDLTGNQALMDHVRGKFKNWYLPDMMNNEGGFPKELARTKPYGYSLFVIDLMGGIAQIASTETDNLWTYTTANDHNMELGLDFITPYIKDKSAWPYAEDVSHWEDWPVRHAALLFGAKALKDCSYYKTVKDLPADSEIYEVTRNFPIRHPIIWL